MGSRTQVVQDKGYMTICSEKTLQSNDKGFFMQFAEAAAQSAGEKWIKNVFGGLSTDGERIRIIYQDAAIKEVVLGTLSHVQEIYRKKNADISQNRRLEAEKTFKNGDAVKALTLFSQSVLRAPKTGQCPKIDSGISLALALWARSEILMDLKKYSLALNDIQLSLKEGLYSTYKGEAFWRMAVCYKAKGEERRAKVSLELAEKLLSKESNKVELLRESMSKTYVEAKKVNRRGMPVIPSPHENIPYATNKMAMKEEPGKGRFAIAGENIATGDTIVCEPPHVACLLPDSFGTHCHNCFDWLESPVGCPDCASVAFCGIECRDVAINSYHKYECKFLDLLIGSGMSILSHAALRMITQRKPDQMYDLNRIRNTEPAYALCTLSEKRSPEDFLQRTLMTAFLLRCLQKCGYFGYVDDNVVPNENQLVVGELLLFHLQMLQFNAHEIYETRHSEEHRFRNATAKYIGLALYPTAALLNHDCHPGVSRHFVGKNVVLTATRPLKPGEMIAENYGPIFTRRTLADRQRSLTGRYWFNCSCHACTQGWPTLSTGLRSINRRVRCPTINCPNLFVLPVANENVKCLSCKRKVCLTENITEIKNCEGQFLFAFECMDRHEVAKGIVTLCSATDTFYRVSAPPHTDAHLGQECLRALLADSGNVYEGSTPVKDK